MSSLYICFTLCSGSSCHPQCMSAIVHTYIHMHSHVYMYIITFQRVWVVYVERGLHVLHSQLVCLGSLSWNTSALITFPSSSGSTSALFHSPHGLSTLSLSGIVRRCQSDNGSNNGMREWTTYQMKIGMCFPRRDTPELWAQTFHYLTSMLSLRRVNCRRPMYNT